MKQEDIVYNIYGYNVTVYQNIIFYRRMPCTHNHHLVCTHFHHQIFMGNLKCDAKLKNFLICHHHTISSRKALSTWAHEFSCVGNDIRCCDFYGCVKHTRKLDEKEIFPVEFIAVGFSFFFHMYLYKGIYGWVYMYPILILNINVYFMLYTWRHGKCLSFYCSYISCIAVQFVISYLFLYLYF